MYLPEKFDRKLKLANTQGIYLKVFTQNPTLAPSPDSSKFIPIAIMFGYAHRSSTI